MVNYEDIFNIYAVYFGYRSGTLIDSNFELVQKLNLNLTTDLVLLNYLGKKINVLSCVTKNKIRKKKISEKELGDILGYFCSSHNWWAQDNIKRIMVHITFKIGNKQITPFPMTCEDSKITSKNCERFIRYLEELKTNYTKIGEYIGIKISPKIVLTTYPNIKLNPKQFLKLKLFN